MSDDFDDDFPVDDSFLREVDNIASKAGHAPGMPSRSSNNRSTSLQAQKSKGWTGPQPQVATGSSRSTSLNIGNRTHTSRPSSTLYNKSAPVKTSCMAPFPIHPSSDDFDEIPLPPESLLALDALSSKPSWKPPISNRFPQASNTIPSSRLIKRTSSNSHNSSSDNFLQTHLSFRKEKQSTNGKRWDRTAFAESGRRIDGGRTNKEGIGKGKGKGRGRTGYIDEDDEDDLDLDDQDDGEPLVPLPKPLVDPSAPYQPQKHLPDLEAISTYIYPTNRSRRDYQYEIVQACFTDNCLVALPTGLGKTFVAGVVMLNFYRWFPTGKIVFLAPTKPLVNQQIEACQLTCGIPSKDAAVMTGSSVSAKERAKMWEERRVFYCTPQTLDNDLKRGAVDPRDIVLAVFDEAHKASGGYAYTTILAYLTAHQPYFRVLALTATPGANVEKVQAVVDALHISRIEIREAEAPEIRKYMNEKRTEKHFVQMGDVIDSFRDRWIALMRPYVAKLVEKDILHDRDLDVKKLKTFRLTSERMRIARDRTSGLRWALGPLQSLEKMATAMRNLLEFSLGMFHTSLMEIAGGVNALGKKTNNKGSANSIRNNFEFVKLLRDVEAEMNCIRIGKDGKTKADRHPKMGKTLDLLLAHFAQAADDADVHGTVNDTRAMVFCSYRDCVLEIVDMLNEHSGLLKATKFVGQSQGKQEEDKGFTQKEQKKTISEFKEGKYNILVATSIGEEGLDIGEVDFVVVYDMPKQPIKLLQRIGRTGRKRDGKVHVLMSEGREDANWDSAQQTHREIQEEILHSRNLELFEDVEPLLPVSSNGRPIMPRCVEQEMEVDPWDPEDQKSKRKLPAASGIASPKRKTGKAAVKSKQRGHEVPDDAPTSFRSVLDLLEAADKIVKGGKITKGTRKKRTRVEVDEDEEEEVELLEDGGDVDDDEEDDDDENLEKLFAETTNGNKGKRKVKIAKGKGKGKDPQLKSKIKEPIPNNQSSSGNPSKRQKKISTVPTQISDDDEDTLSEIEGKMTRRSREEMNRSALDFFNTEGPLRLGNRGLTPLATPPSSPDRESEVGRKRATHPQISPKSDESLDREIIGLFKGKGKGKADITQAVKPVGGIRNGILTPGTAAAAAGFDDLVDLSMDWDIELSQDPTPARNVGRMPHTNNLVRVEEVNSPVPVSTSTSYRAASGRLTVGNTKIRMPPPPIPLRTSSPMRPESRVSTPTIEATQFPVRRAGAGRRRGVVLSSNEKPAVGDRVEARDDGGVNSDPLDSPFVPPRRIRRRIEVPPSSSPPPLQSVPRRARPSGRGGRRQRVPEGELREYLDLAVSVSGSDHSSDEPLSDHSTHSDRLFANDFQPTQAPKGYNQHAVYLAGLSTQIAPKHGLKFKSRHDTLAFMSKARRPVLITDDEMSGSDGGRRGGDSDSDESENEYELGSFVCDDDDVEEVVYSSEL